MADLVVIVPSRGRATAAGELVEAFRSTCTASTVLIFAVDEDDPRRDAYGDVCDGVGFGTLIIPSHTMVEALNRAAASLAAEPRWSAIGFLGDDHRPRTPGWDARYLEALGELGTGMVYGDDLYQGEKLPTQIAMTADIVRTLGYMAPPQLTHLFVDDYWRDLGRSVGCLRYLPDVVVEHLHPAVGKADWDEGYNRVNAPAMYQRDRGAYLRFRGEGRFAADVLKVQALREGR